MEEPSDLCRLTSDFCGDEKPAEKGMLLLCTLSDKHPRRRHYRDMFVCLLHMMPLLHLL